MHQPADPVQILHRQWAIEPQFGADLGKHLRIGALLAGEHERRVARHQLLQAEHEDAHQHQRRDQLQKAAAQSLHGATVMPWSRIMPSATGLNPLTLALRPLKYRVV